jgi:hypothetical protein
LALFDNLSAWWKMDQASGDEPDACNAHTLFDDTTTAATTGQVSGARDFSNDYFHANHATDLNGSAAFSLALWVKLSTDAQYLVHKGWTDGGAAREFILLTASDGGTGVQFTFAKDNGSGVQQVDSAGATLGAWHLVVCVYKGADAEMKISVDGGAFTVASVSTGIQTGTANFWVGAQPSGGLTGQLDEIGYWRRALDSSDVAALWNSGAGITFTDNSPAAGIGHVKVTPVAPTVIQGAQSQLDKVIKIAAPAPGGSTHAAVIQQPIKISSPATGVGRSWTSGDPGLLELTAIAPTATLRASAGLGRLKTSTPGIITLENAGLLGIGHLTLHGVTPTPNHGASISPAAINLAGPAGTTSKRALHEWGRVWMTPPAADVGFAAAAGQGTIDVTAVAPGGQHDEPLGIGLWTLDFALAAAAHAAVLSPAAMNLAGPAPAGAKAAASGQALLDFTYVVTTTTKGADCSPLLVELATPAASTTKTAADVDLGLWTLDFGLAGSTHGAASGPALLHLSGVSPDTSHAAADLDLGLWTLDVGLGTGLHGAVLPAASVEFVGIASLTPKTAGDLDVASLELLGIRATRPYRKYAKLATLTRLPTTSTLARRTEED